MRHEGPVIGARLVDGQLTGQRLVLTWSVDRTVRLWHAADGTPAAAPMHHSHLVDGATVSPEGRLIMTWSSSWMTLWHVAEQAPVALAMIQPECEVEEAHFESEGQVLASCRSGTTLGWSLATKVDVPPHYLPMLVQVTTGTTMDNVGNLSVLDAGEWSRLRQELSSLGTTDVGPDG
jgi:hypothetical protein